jgi:hypothetical protein
VTRFRREALAPVALLLAAACAGAPDSRLEAYWTADSAEGRFQAPATARLCAGNRLLITAIQGDSGFGVLVLGADSTGGGPPATGAHPVGDPAVPLPRPGAALSLRASGEGGSRGYQGRDGTVELAADGSGWSAEFEGRLVSLDGGETLAVAGRVRVPAPVPAGACDDSAAAALP